MSQTDNPYETPKSDGGNSTAVVDRVGLLVAASILATAGVFAGSWYVAYIALWLFVFGDDHTRSPEVYALAVAVLPTIAAGWWLLQCVKRRKWVAITVALIVTFPILTWMTVAVAGWGWRLKAWTPKTASAATASADLSSVPLENQLLRDVDCLR